MTDTEAYVALNLIPRMGPVRLRRLLGTFGTPQAILAARPADLQAVEGMGPESIRHLTSWRETIRWEEELRLADKMGARILSHADPDYPPCLREIHDPPIVLYCWGTLAERDRHALGVVGTRKPSHYAAECAKKLSFQVAHSGLTIVSGLARGIDTLAHQAALAAGGRTLAVIGSGLGKIYPPENIPLAEKIAAEGGAVLSEFPLMKVADRQTFPMRNRIISGLSFGLLVVEAGGRSGALISASQAAEQGRSLYAVPGRIDNPNALGSNRLIQQGAKLVLSAADILEDMSLLFPRQPDLPGPPRPPDLTAVEQGIWDALAQDELLLDQIVAETGLPSHEVSSTLLALEIRGLVKPLPGARFVRLH